MFVDSKPIDDIIHFQISCLVNFRQVFINNFDRRKDIALSFPPKFSDCTTQSAIQQYQFHFCDQSYTNESHRSNFSKRDEL